MTMKESLVRTAGPEVKARTHGIPVHIEQHCWDKMFGWCRAAKTEISGYGLISLKDGMFKVREVFLPEQKCSTGYTLIESASLGRLMYYLDRERAIGKPGYDPMNPESLDLQFWWHTHYDFGTFWSGTDDDQAQKVAHHRGDWSVSLVINQAGDWLCRTDIIQPVPIMVDELPVFITDNSKKFTKRDYQRDIDKWVKPLHEPKKEFFTWGKKKLTPTVGAIPMGSKYIIHGGKLMTMEQYSLALICHCGDGTCSDCVEDLKDLGAITNESFT